MVDVVNAPAGMSYAGPSFDDLSAAAAGSGLSIPDNPPGDSSLLSAAYWQQKVADFQATLDALDQGYYAAQIALNSDSLLAADPTLYDDLSKWIADFDAKKSAFRLCAQALNGGIAVVNSLGGNFQSVNLPSTLGMPFAVPAIWAAAFATAAVLIAWGVSALQGLNARLARAQLLQNLPPDAAAAAAQSLLQSDQALQSAQGSTFSQIANLVKWGGIALLGFFAYRAISAHPKARGWLGMDA
jgi:hypothetical protein